MSTNTPLVVRNTIRHYAALPEPTTPDPGKIGLIVSCMEAEIRAIEPAASLEQVRDMRHLVLAWLFTPDNEPMQQGISIKSLTPQQVNGLWRWLSPEKPVGEKTWLPRAEFNVELRQVLARALRDWQTTQVLAMGDHNSISMNDLLAGVPDGDQGGYISRLNLIPKAEQLTIDFHPGG